jgi:hypothetical protein
VAGQGWAGRGGRSRASGAAAQLVQTAWVRRWRMGQLQASAALLKCACPAGPAWPARACLTVSPAQHRRAPLPLDGRLQRLNHVQHRLGDLRADAVARNERHDLGGGIAGPREVGHAPRLRGGRDFGLHSRAVRPRQPDQPQPPARRRNTKRDGDRAVRRAPPGGQRPASMPRLRSSAATAPAGPAWRSREAPFPLLKFGGPLLLLRREGSAAVRVKRRSSAAVWMFDAGAARSRSHPQFRVRVAFPIALLFIQLQIDKWRSRAAATSPTSFLSRSPEHLIVCCCCGI